MTVSITNDTNRQATLIQSLYRGYRTRKWLGRKWGLDLKFEATHLLGKIIHVAKQAERNYKRHIVRQDKEIEVLDPLNRLKYSITDLQERIVQSFFKAHCSLKQVTEKRAQFLDEVRVHQEILKDICSQAGFKDVCQGMEIIFGENWMDQFPLNCIYQIMQFSSIFQPVAYKIVNVCGIDDGGLCYLESGSLEQPFAQNATLIQSGIPYVTAMRFFSESTLTQKLQGAELNIPYKDSDGNDKVVVMSGLFGTDPVGAEKTISILKDKVKALEEQMERLDHIPKVFRENYVEQYPIRDLFLQQPKEIVDELEEDYAYVQKIGDLMKPSELAHFAISDISRQMKIFSLLLMKDDPQVAVYLFEMSIKKLPLFQQVMRNTLHYSLQKKLDLAIDDLRTSLDQLKKLKGENVPYETKIVASKMPPEAKEIAMEKYKLIKSRSSEADKAESFLNALLKIPFGKYTKELVTKDSSEDEIKNHLIAMREAIDTATHGQDEAKLEILKWRAQLISNSESNGAVFAIEGPKGVGKTTLVRDGIAKALGRPCIYINMGGEVDVYHLAGHGYTWHGSQMGLLDAKLIQAQCMDPVFCFDEIDKVKDPNLIWFLSALVDPSQNKEFSRSKYFSGINFDFSRALFVFLLNDVNQLHPIFKDRLYMIYLSSLTMDEKKEIAQKYMLPKILKDIGFKPDEIKIENDVVQWIINKYTQEEGVRELEKKLYAIIREINYNRYRYPGSIKFPFQIDQEYAKEVIKTPPKKEFNSMYG